MDFDGKPWVVAKDVCDALGLADNHGSISHHITKLYLDEKRITSRSDIEVSGKGGPITLISESGCYKLVMRSDKPFAKEFQNWLARVVIPAIRKEATSPVRSCSSPGS